MSELSTELRPLVAIHQPNFFPWLGYFHKMRWADTFVLLDDVQIQKTGGSVTNRAAFSSNGKQIYFTAPIDRSQSGALRIDQVQFSTREDFRGRFATFLEQAYAKAAFAKELGGEIFDLVRNPSSSLSEYNSSAIRRLAELLGLRSAIVTSSTLGVGTTSTARLVEIVEALGGRTYLAGAGAKDYQEDSRFFARKINVLGRAFVAEPYPRGREAPLTGLSILDALFHLGVAGTRALLEQPLDPGLLRLANEAPANEAPNTAGTS